IGPPASWEHLDAALGALSTFSWLVFTSVNGVTMVDRRLSALGLAWSGLTGRRVAAIGPATADALREHGVRVDVVPAEYRAEGLVERLRGLLGRGDRVLLPRAAQTRDVLVTSLRPPPPSTAWPPTSCPRSTRSPPSRGRSSSGSRGSRSAPARGAGGATDGPRHVPPASAAREAAVAEARARDGAVGRRLRLPAVRRARTRRARADRADAGSAPLLGGRAGQGVQGRRRHGHPRRASVRHPVGQGPARL